MTDSRRSTRPPRERAKNLTALNAQLKREIGARGRAEKTRLKLERGLREVRELFETAFGNAPIGMALVDMNGRWLQLNGALSRITGLSPDELKATTLDAISHPEDVGLAADDMQSLLGGSDSQLPVEKRYRHAWDTSSGCCSPFRSFAT